MIILNSQVVKFGLFPNGECNLKMEGLPIQANNYVTFTFEDDGEFFKLALLKSFLDVMNTKTNLIVTYMPYSRMDRVNGVYVISCPVACNQINNMKFKSVSIREPHSKVCVELTDRSTCYNWTAMWISTLMGKDGWDTLFFPDKGAVSRYDHFGVLPTHAYGTKTREFATGNIEQYSIKGEVGKRVLIVDDLCSRGGTFVAAAKLLKKAGTKHIGLLVAMCEENVHTGELFNYIDRLYTSNDCKLTQHPRITFL